jgi:hypothetical protein
MTNEEFEPPSEDADGPADKQKPTGENLAELVTKQTRMKEALARMVEAAAVIEAQARSID